MKTVCGRTLDKSELALMRDEIPMHDKTCESCLRILRNREELGDFFVKLVSWHALKEMPNA